MSPDLTMDFRSLEKLKKEFLSNLDSSFSLETVAIRNSQTADPIEVLVKLNRERKRD